jgi:hypothetical protein
MSIPRVKPLDLLVSVFVALRRRVGIVIANKRVTYPSETGERDESNFNITSDVLYCSC